VEIRAETTVTTNFAHILYAKWTLPDGMAVIPAGTFIMGSPTTELGRLADEPQVQVTLTRTFYLGVTEVTQGQWKSLSGGVNPACFQTTTCTACSSSNANDNGPVEQVDWYSVLGYLNALSARDGLPSCYTLTGCSDPVNGWNDGAHTGCTGATFVGLSCTGYRLPTEAEWEYAARAGTTTSTYLGNLSGIVSDCSTGQANLDSIAWWCRNSGSRTQAVKQKTLNAWGLSDMLGNVWEWVWDWYGNYPGAAQTDPMGAGAGERRVNRGGGWDVLATDARAARRVTSSPWYRFGLRGFRPARSIP
jgi:formylglycine-generating enzyme required for sulfatase activity